MSETNIIPAQTGYAKLVWSRTLNEKHEPVVIRVPIVGWEVTGNLAKPITMETIAREGTDYAVLMPGGFVYVAGSVPRNGEPGWR